MGREYGGAAPGGTLEHVQRPDDTKDPVIGRRDLQPDDWQEIEVLVDDVWHEGDLRAWTQRRNTGWWAHVQYSRGPAQTYLDTVPADRIRPVELNDELRGVLAFTERTFPDDQARDAALHAELQISPLRYQMQVAWLRHHGHLDEA